MPDRVIRDELLRSERYWSVSIEAQRFFVHLLLNVDDTARFSGKNYTLRSACYPGQAIDPEKLERLLSELVDVDLVRVYEHQQERFIFVPRFKQRLRFTKSKFPSPPNEINDIVIEKTVSSLTQDGLKSDSRRQKRREEKRSEVKRSKTLTTSASADSAFEHFWKFYPRKTAKAAARKAWEKLHLSIDLQAQLIEAIGRHRNSEQWQRGIIPHPATWLNGRRWEDESVNVSTLGRCTWNLNGNRGDGGQCESDGTELRNGQPYCKAHSQRTVAV